MTNAQKAALARLDIVGPQEIIDRLGRSRAWIDNLKYRDELPTPDLSPSGHDLWLWSTIEDWWAKRLGKR